MREKILIPAMVVAMFLWGGSWASSKVLIAYAPSYIIAFWRFALVLLACFFLMLVLKISFKFENKDFKWVLLAGLCNGLYALCFFAGLNYGAAGKGGVLVTTTVPLFAFLLLRLSQVFRAIKLGQHLEKIPKNQSLGLCLGLLSGLCLLELSGFDELFGKFNTFFLLAAFDWALMSLITHKININPLALNFWVTLIALLLFLPIFADERAFFIVDADFTFWINFIFLSIFSTVIGTGIYYLGIRYLGAIRANSFMLLVPAAALLTSFLILGEVPSLLTMLGAVLAIFSIYLVNKKAKI